MSDFDLEAVDGLKLSDELRALLRPGELAEAEGGIAPHLPRYFYAVPSWAKAHETILSPHFKLSELMTVDCREAALLFRTFPHHVPCAVVLLARYLEDFRRDADAVVFVSANGGYRSPAHQRNKNLLGPHCWATAADIYRVGDTYLNDEKSIARYSELAKSLGPQVFVRAYSEGDDHMHIDLGFITVTPRDCGRIEISLDEGIERESSTFVPGEVPGGASTAPGVGIEAEFALYVDGVKCRPEAVFGTPARLIGQPMIPRIGRSFQLPSGGAIYFDTGVIEVATPIVEIEPGCCYRATRLLWEQIRCVRQELDVWSQRNKCHCRLEGFSTHYNFSFPDGRKSATRTSSRLGYLLAHILPIPVALLAANRKSTAIGVRPRPSRVEVTADFTPDAALMLATCGFIAGAVEGILDWNDFEVDQLSKHGIPEPVPFRLRKHSSRRGWRVMASSLEHDPFTADPNEAIWKLRGGRVASLREIAMETLRPFRREVRRLSDEPTLQHIDAVFAGDARSLLDFPDRPGAYEDAGHGIDWNRRRMRHWARSDYEKVIHRVIAREPIRIDGKRYTVERMQGWYEIVFRESKENRRRVFNLDELVRLTRKRRR